MTDEPKATTAYTGLVGRLRVQAGALRAGWLPEGYSTNGAADLCDEAANAIENLVLWFSAAMDPWPSGRLARSADEDLSA